MEWHYYTARYGYKKYYLMFFAWWSLLLALISKTPLTIRRLIQCTYIRQKAGFTVHSTDTDQEVQNYFQILWPAVCQSSPDIFNLRPSHFITILENKVNISPENSSRIFFSRLPKKNHQCLHIFTTPFSFKINKFFRWKL